MPSSRYIIQIDLPTTANQNLDALAEELTGTGVELDRSYRPVCINPKLGRYVMRGTASPEARHAAERISGIQFFSDVPVQGAGKGAGFGPAN
jgi:hypothetical protein